MRLVALTWVAGPDPACGPGVFWRDDGGKIPRASAATIWPNAAEAPVGSSHFSSGVSWSPPSVRCRHNGNDWCSRAGRYLDDDPCAGVRIAAWSRCWTIHVVHCRISYPCPWIGRK
jgi:hypothetical protein